MRRKVSPTIHEAVRSVTAGVPSSLDRAALERLRIYIDGLKATLNNEINSLVNDLRGQIMDPGQPGKKGFFDGVKKWWTNLWYKDHDERNPYFWQNRIGNLGQNESALTVHEHRMIQELAFILEEQGAMGTPRMTNILNNWKAKVNDVIGRYLDTLRTQVDAMIAAAPATTAMSPEMPGEDPEGENEDDKPEDTKPIEKEVPGTDDLIGGEEDEDNEDDLIGGEEDEDNEDEEDDEDEDEDLIDDEEDDSASPDPLPPIGADRDPVNSIEVMNPRFANRVESILIKLANMSKEDKAKATDTEKMVFNTIWAPWEQYTSTEQGVWNARGGKQRRKTAKRGEPVVLPHVLRVGDPRRPILKRWYEDLWKKLYYGTDKEERRVERGPKDPGGPDTEAWVEQRKRRGKEGPDLRAQARQAGRLKREEEQRRNKSEPPLGPDDVAAKRLGELGRIKDDLDKIDHSIINGESNDSLNKLLDDAKNDDSKLKILNKWIELYELAVSLMSKLSDEDKEHLKSSINKAAQTGNLKELLISVHDFNTADPEPVAGDTKDDDDEEILKRMLSHTVYDGPIMAERVKYLRALLAEQSQTGRIVVPVSKWRALPFKDRLKAMTESLRR